MSWWPRSHHSASSCMKKAWLVSLPPSTPHPSALISQTCTCTWQTTQSTKNPKTSSKTRATTTTTPQPTNALCRASSNKLTKTGRATPTWSRVRSAGTRSRSWLLKLSFRAISLLLTPIERRSHKIWSSPYAFRSLASIFSLIKRLSHGSLKWTNHLRSKRIHHWIRELSWVCWVMHWKYLIYRLDARLNTWLRRRSNSNNDFKGIHADLHLMRKKYSAKSASKSKIGRSWLAKVDMSAYIHWCARAMKVCRRVKRFLSFKNGTISWLPVQKKCGPNLPKVVHCKQKSELKSFNNNGSTSHQLIDKLPKLPLRSLRRKGSAPCQIRSSPYKRIIIHWRLIRFKHRRLLRQRWSKQTAKSLKFSHHRWGQQLSYRTSRLRSRGSCLKRKKVSSSRRNHYLLEQIRIKSRSNSWNIRPVCLPIPPSRTLGNRTRGQ